MLIRHPCLGLVVLAVLAAGIGSFPPQAVVATSPDSSGARAAEIRGLLEDGYPPRAEARARELVSPAELDGRVRSLEAAELVRLLARAMRSNGKQADPETRRLSELAVAIAVDAAGEPSLAVAENRFDLAILCFVLRDHAGARREFEEALAQREKLLGPDHSEVAEVLTYLGYLVYEERRDIGEAQRLFARARAIQESAPDPDPLDVAFRWGREAIVLENAGDWSGALEAHERALAIYVGRLRPGHPLIAMQHNNMGSMCLNRCDWAGAAFHLERALDARRAELSETHINVAKTMFLLAQVRDHLGESDEALALWQGSLQVFENALGRSDERLLLPLEALAAAHLESGELDVAEQEIQRARDILSSGGSTGGIQLALVDRLTAQLAFLRGERTAALEHLRRGLARLEAVPSAEAFRAELLQASSRFLLLGESPADIEQGTANLLEALDLERQAFGVDNSRSAWILGELAVALLRADHDEEAFERALEAGAIVRKNLRSTAARFEERNALGDAAHTTPGLALCLWIAAHEPAPGRALQAWDGLVRSRSLVFEEMSTRRKLAALSHDPTVGALARSLSQARERYANLAVRGEMDPARQGLRDSIEEARMAREHAERDLAEATAADRASLEPVDAGCAEVIASLPPGVALVSFARVTLADRRPAEYVALLWPPGATEPAIRALGDADAIDGLVKRALAESRSSASEVEYRRVAGELRARIWDPWAPSISGAREICVVPDGALVLLDLSALPVGENEYLIERAPPIHYLSNERDLLPEEDRPIGRGLLACGGPDYERASVAESDPVLLAASAPPGAPAAWAARGPSSPWSTRLSELEFADLPAAASETLHVAALWNEWANRTQWHDGDEAGAAVLTGAEATEEAFERLARGKAVLHLATHGFFLPSASPAGPRSVRGVPTWGLAPLPATFDLSLASDHSLLSGLAFAGANVRSGHGAPQDGILLAEEICALDLSGVRLAVLSACDTGLGQVQNGEGVFGLRRAFQLAGVRTLVTSLWPVVDQTTEKRMLEFYRRWLGQDESVAQALRSAALLLLEERRARGESTHPFHWAGFVAVGGRS